MSTEIAGIAKEAPILQQPKSSLVTTSPFIPNEQKELELHVLEQEANNIVEDAYNSNKTSSISDLSVRQILRNTGTSLSGLFNDLFVKPDDVSWLPYLSIIVQKDQRYAYLGLVLILVAIVKALM